MVVAGRADIFNRGFSGYTTALALAILDSELPPPSSSAGHPLLATVFFGANDACAPPSSLVTFPI